MDADRRRTGHHRGRGHGHRRRRPRQRRRVQGRALRSPVPSRRSISTTSRRTIELPPGEIPGGLQDRFQVVAVNPFALEHAGVVGLDGRGDDVIRHVRRDTPRSTRIFRGRWPTASGTSASGSRCCCTARTRAATTGRSSCPRTRRRADRPHDADSGVHARHPRSLHGQRDRGGERSDQHPHLRRHVARHDHRRGRRRPAAVGGGVHELPRRERRRS